MAEGKIPIETSSKVDYDKLVGQDRVDVIFKPLEKEHGKHLQEIEELEFLFRNCCYNKNRLIEEIDRSRAGFGFPNNETAKKFADSMGIKKPKDRFEMGIPITLWADIIIFEFHAFLSNIIRCCNFLAIFKLKNVDKIQDTKYVTIGRYYWGKLEKKIKDKGGLHDFIMAQYQGWIADVNHIRNEIIHEYMKLVREMQGYLIFSYERISENSMETKGDIKVGIPEYKIENLETYVSGILGKLESFIKEFVEKFGD